MERIKAKVAGTDQDILVDVDMEKIKYDPLNNFITKLLEAYTNQITDSMGKDKLTEAEMDSLIGTLADDYHVYPFINSERLIPSIISGTLYSLIVTIVENIVNGREKYYTFQVKYSGSFDAVVKANCEDQALDFLEERSDYELSKYVSWDDIEYEVADCIEVEDEATDNDFLDATES